MLLMKRINNNAIDQAKLVKILYWLCALKHDEVQ